MSICCSLRSRAVSLSSGALPAHGSPSPTTSLSRRHPSATCLSFSTNSARRCCSRASALAPISQSPASSCSRDTGL
eukprot:CAMPEP_0179329328 /NCGR_PEP_ID=MMETSP0797-20121207/63059_1 /TAXON_ID=47934 /ORGANISM="Dinophysis acuminata, Strain DAEP01" /LENGTH=75 /DNA_ID=CAMNT_0021041957 /DNA_START=79 /DNA_END=303 /DNA_ORIENTATION=-